MSNPRCYLVDSSIYVFRAWFTWPEDIVDSEGQPANAVHGFADFLFRFLSQVKPKHIAFAFDESLATSYRHDIYPDYKANRPPAPESLKRQFKQCRRLLDALNLANLASNRCEADDLIGTLGRIEKANGSAITYVTGDKDLTQLLTDEQDLWWEFGRNKKMDWRGVYKQLGTYPNQIADQLAIAGDKVDNIPGVPGIGMATAAKLLRRYETLDKLLDNIADIENSKIRGAFRFMNLINQYQDQIRLAKQLTLIDTQADLNGLRITPWQAPAFEHIDDTLNQLNLNPKRWELLLAGLH